MRLYLNALHSHILIYLQQITPCKGCVCHCYWLLCGWERPLKDAVEKLNPCDHRFSVVVEWQTGRYVDITDREKRIKEIDDFYEYHYRGFLGDTCSYSSSCVCFGKMGTRNDLQAADENGWILDKEGYEKKATKLACEKCGEVKSL